MSGGDKEALREATDAVRLIEAFQQFHAVLMANEDIITQQKLLEVLTVRAVILDAEPGAGLADIEQDLEVLHKQVRNLIVRFFAADVEPVDEFLMTLMLSIKPKGEM